MEKQLSIVRYLQESNLSAGIFMVPFAFTNQQVLKGKPRLDYMVHVVKVNSPVGHIGDFVFLNLN